MRPRILIFEDNDILLSTLKFVFSERGYEVLAFSEPERCQSYDAVNLTCPADIACSDVLISDVNMPTISGLNLIRELQQKGCQIKYRALMSADWTDTELESARELGCYIFHKPFDLLEMIEWLNDCRDELSRAIISAPTGNTEDMEEASGRDRYCARKRIVGL